MCNRNWSTCFHLLLEKWYYTTITSKYISKSYNYIFCSGILTKCLHDHLTQRLDAPMTFVGLTALSVEMRMKRCVPKRSAACATLYVPKTYS